MKSTAITLAVWSPQMADHIEKSLIAKGLLIRGFIVRGVKKRDLIGQSDTERSPNMMSLDTTTMTQK
jgi:hypothetical protein